MENAHVESRLSAIEGRLAQIEKRLDIVHPTAPAPQQQPSVPSAVIEDTGDVSEPKSGNWLGIVASICFIMAAGFIIKLSIDSGWLTPVRQIGIASLFGIGLIGAGLALVESDRPYASYLPGAGVIILFATTFASHLYYALIPFDAALALTVAVSAICIWLYTKIHHDIYPITAAVGAYAAPILLGLHAEAIFAIYYFLVCSGAFAIVATKLRTRTLILISAYLALGATALVGLDLHQDILIACLLACQFIVFSVATYCYSCQTDIPLKDNEGWAYFPVLLLFYAIEYHLIEGTYPGLAPWISLGFAAILMGLYFSAAQYFPKAPGSRSLVITFSTIVGFHSVYLEILPENFRPWLLAIIALSVAFCPLDFKNKDKGGLYRIPAFALLAVIVMEYFDILRFLASVEGSAWLPVSFVSLGALWVVLLRGKHISVVNLEGKDKTLLLAAHLLAIFGFYRLATDSGSLAVSAFWLFYGAGVILVAFIRKDEVMAKSALFVLGFAAAKALVYDAGSAPTVVRIFCLILTGAVLYGCGYFMRQFSQWTKTKPNQVIGFE